MPEGLKYVRMKLNTAQGSTRYTEGQVVELPDDGTAERWLAGGIAGNSTEAAYQTQQQAAADRAEEEEAAAASAPPPAIGLSGVQDDETGQGPEPPPIIGRGD